jgi:glucokinase
MVEDSTESVLVYDVGGSHISAAVCHAGDYRLGPVVRANIPETQTSDAFIEVLASLADQANNGASPVLGAELAMPGPFDYEAGISQMRHKMPNLFGVSVRQTLATRLGWRPEQVRFLNDAAAYLLGEVGAGAAHGICRAVGITLGTGVGSAFAVNGRVVTEGKGVPTGGEVWNVPYEGGIVEDQISTRALQKSYRERTGKEREVASIAHYAAGGEQAANEVFTEFGTHLGRVLRHLFTEFAPDVVVLGGGISRSSYLFIEAAKKELSGMKIELRITKLGDTAPLVGAGVAWFTHFSAGAAAHPAASTSA